MKQTVQKIETFFLRSDAWIYLGGILLISLMQTNWSAPFTWGEYLSYLFILIIYFLPILVFEHHKALLRATLSRLQLLGLWAICYPGYLFFAALIMQLWGRERLFLQIENIEFFPIISLTAFWFSLALAFNNYLTKKLPKVEWIKKLSLDKAILITLFGLALLFSVMAVSNLEEFYQKGLIHVSFNPSQVLFNFGILISFTIQFFATYLTGYFFYYINKHFLVPKLLKTRGFLIYACGLVGTTAFFYPIFAQLLILFPISQNIMSLLPSENFHVFDPLNGMVAFSIMVFSVPIILVIQWFQQNNEITTLEKEKAEVELGLLKQQINPHFFFNTLNNLYALSLKKSDLTPEVIMQLSELMRYVIYKGKEQLVPLCEEIKYIEDYINLQQIRLHKSFKFRIAKHIENKDLLIPPLLLIILVENAFKHGIEPAEQQCFLNINLQSNEQEFFFHCENSFEEEIDKERGIGLENLQRRLSLRYPNRHEFWIEKKRNTFQATLKILLR